VKPPIWVPETEEEENNVSDESDEQSRPKQKKTPGKGKKRDRTNKKNIA
jgi:hypothetical protein